MPAWWAPSNATRPDRAPPDRRRLTLDPVRALRDAGADEGAGHAPAATATAPAPAATARKRRRLSADVGGLRRGRRAQVRGDGGVGHRPPSGRQPQAAGQLAEDLGQLRHARLEGLEVVLA